MHIDTYNTHIYVYTYMHAYIYIHACTHPYIHVIVVTYIGMNDLSDMYVQSLRATGLKAEGIYIRQIMIANIIHVALPSGKLKEAQARNL